MRAGRRERVTDLARSCVTRLAPEELPLFDATCTAYFAHPRRALRRRDGDAMLDFGVDAVIAAVTVAALAAVNQAMQTAATDLGESTGHRIGRAVRRGWHRLVGWLRRRPPPDEPAEPDPPKLTSGQLARVREAAFRHARATGLGAERAALLADAIVGALVDGG